MTFFLILLASAAVASITASLWNLRTDGLRRTPTQPTRVPDRAPQASTPSHASSHAQTTPSDESSIAGRAHVARRAVAQPAASGEACPAIARS